MSRTTLSAAVLLLLTLGCGSKSEAPSEAPAAAPAGPSGQPSPAAAPAPAPTALPTPELKPPSAAELPVPEDFEAEAEATISKATYKKQLATLEREIESATAR